MHGGAKTYPGDVATADQIQRLADEYRGAAHDLAKRAELAASTGLRLRKRTLLHLNDLSHSREYLVTRYGAELAGSWTQLNRLMATLDEIATKVALALALKSAMSAAAAKTG
ncbi:hypothetical protein [Rhizorhapis sp. SPR117]|uniref:hypothetical protein n=1 Tax=Rhizorhapis sp. SPR117 TaxID=2912611 RepID=UPI001F456DFB|nr:hypothetical protein [Rhizorhapis sp. SPR117]